MQTHAVGKSILKTTHTDGDSTAGTLQVKLLAEKTQFGIKSGVHMPALMEIKMQGSYSGCKDWNILLKKNKIQITYCFWDSPDLHMDEDQALEGSRQIAHVKFQREEPFWY